MRRDAPIVEHIIDFVPGLNFPLFYPFFCLFDDEQNRSERRFQLYTNLYINYPLLLYCTLFFSEDLMKADVCRVFIGPLAKKTRGKGLNDFVQMAL